MSLQASPLTDPHPEIPLVFNPDPFQLPSVRTADFDYQLPQELIAQSPLPARDASRLLVLNRTSGQIEHRLFPALVEYLSPGDLLVLNDSKVIPARLRGQRANGGRMEILLLREIVPKEWWVLLRPGKRVPIGSHIQFQTRAGRSADLVATILEKNAEGHGRVRFETSRELSQVLDECGDVPLPPYITRSPQSQGINDFERYQTVFAAQPGSVAAPTAGLHFTPELLTKIRNRGIEICSATLHVGLATFVPVKSSRIQGHVMHSERFNFTAEAAEAVGRTRENGGRIVAVGTTAARVLETVVRRSTGRLSATAGETDLFIFPPYRFRCVDALLTNFHLPRSTLLMLVSAFAAPGETLGRELVLSAYAQAVREQYRFFSYGDAMLIL